MTLTCRHGHEFVDEELITEGLHDRCPECLAPMDDISSP